MIPMKASTPHSLDFLFFGASFLRVILTTGVSRILSLKNPTGLSFLYMESSIKMANGMALQEMGIVIG